MRYLHNVIKSPRILIEEDGAKISTKIDMAGTGISPMLKMSEVESKLLAQREQYEAEIAELHETYREQIEAQKQSFDADKARFKEENFALAQRELENAKIEAIRYLSETEKLCEENLTKASVEGFDKGYAEGLEKAIAENQVTLAYLKNVIDGMSQAQSEIIEKYEEQLVDFAVDLASKILGSEIKASDKAVVSLVTDTISKLKDFKRVRIYLAGFDVKVETIANELVARKLIEYKEYVTVEFLDDAIDGTCIVETDDEIIDTSVYDQIKNLSKRLREGRREI